MNGLRAYVLIDTVSNTTIDAYNSLPEANKDRRTFAAEYPGGHFEIHQQMDVAGRSWRKVL